MPEGDTVYRAAAKLDRALTGHRLTLSDFRVPAFATVDLREGTVIRTLSRGKHLLTRIDHQRAWTLHTHLKMEGSWHVYPDGERWRRPDTQVRLVLGIEGRRAVGFQLGIVELVPREQEADLVAHLGPDLLGPDWDEERALANLRDEPGRPDRTGAARPAQPGRHRQHVHGRAVLHQRGPPGQRRRHRRPAPPARAARRSRCSRSTRSGRSRRRPATSASASGCGSTVATTRRAAGAAPRSRSPCSASSVASARPTGVPSCQPER